MYESTRLGRLYQGDPLPVVTEVTTYYPAGAVTFGVEGCTLFEGHADEAWAGGPTLHVFDTDTGLEHLRFDAFPGEEHYHYLTPGVHNHWIGYDTTADGEFLDWIVDRVTNRLDVLLQATGATELAERLDPETISTVLVDVERHLRDRTLLLNGRKASTVSTAELVDLVIGTEEVALVDVRERGDIAMSGTLLLAVSIPLSELDFRISRFIPRTNTRIVLIDGNGGPLAGAAAGILAHHGYVETQILAGGTTQWAADGHELYTSVQALGQVFGEFLERAESTPHITVADARVLVDQGKDVVFLDSRPIAEFESHSLPHGISAPGAEIVHRGIDLITSPETVVVVNCAGRTRSIVGAQALINSGVPNTVLALEGGTMSWSLDGHSLVHGASVQAQAPADPSDSTRSQAAERLSDRFGIGRVAHGNVRELLNGSTDRTVYLLDVRGPEEYRSGHLESSLSTPSWDVAPWVFRHLAVLHSRLILIDDGAGLRGALTGSWFVQQGWKDVSILSLADIDDDLLVTGEETRPQLDLGDDVVSISADELSASREKYTVVDLATSAVHRQGHIRGALFATRSSITLDPSAVPGTGAVVLTSPDGSLAKATARQIGSLNGRPIVVLDGGTETWHERGFTFESDLTAAIGSVNDIAPSPWEAVDKNQAFRDYLDWEIDLIKQIDRDVTNPFTVAPQKG